MQFLPLVAIYFAPRSHFLPNQQSRRPQNLYQATHPLDAIFFIIQLSPSRGNFSPTTVHAKTRLCLPCVHFSPISPQFSPLLPLLQQSSAFGRSGCDIAINLNICRRQRKDKNGHSPRGSVLGYSDPANEKLLPGPRNGTINHR